MNSLLSFSLIKSKQTNLLTSITYQLLELRFTRGMHQANVIALQHYPAQMFLRPSLIINLHDRIQRLIHILI